NTARGVQRAGGSAGTSPPLRAHGPEPCASTNSATSARNDSVAPRLLAESGAPLGVAVRVDQVPVALHVAALRADDEQHEVLVAGVRDLAPRSRRRVEEPAR